MPKIRFRPPAAAGRFYESAPAALRRQVGSLVDSGRSKTEAIGCILPHAGYVYSGKVAGRTVSSLRIRPHLILLGPNHTGAGNPFSFSLQTWETPLGKCRVDDEMAAALTAECALLREDDRAHEAEHSLEVELPFFQYLGGDFRIFPVCIGGGGPCELIELGRAIANAVKKSFPPGSVLIAASSDMTHYEDSSSAGKKDRAALDAVSGLDAEELYRRVLEMDISMCGYAPVMSLLEAAKRLGAVKAEIIEYANSGEVSGDFSSVVGYAGVVIS